MPFQWLVPPRDVFPFVVEDYTRATVQAGKLVAEQMADEAEQWMKQTAPWEDQTGAAREGLAVDVVDAPGAVVELVFRHGVPYGGYLEVSHGGKNSIIGPAIDFFGPRLMQYIQRQIDSGVKIKRR
jgi:hypothetical protein